MSNPRPSRRAGWRRADALPLALTLLWTVIVGLALALAGCGPARTDSTASGPPAPVSTSSASATPGPRAFGSPTASSPAMRITVTVKDVSASDRSITLADPFEGVDRVTLTDESQVVLADGKPGALQDVKPGMVVQVFGPPVGDGSVKALRVTIVQPGGRSSPAR